MTYISGVGTRSAPGAGAPHLPATNKLAYLPAYINLNWCIFIINHLYTPLYMRVCMYVCAAGGIIAGIISDRLNARAITCVSFLLLAVPFVSFPATYFFWCCVRINFVILEQLEKKASQYYQLLLLLLFT